MLNRRNFLIKSSGIIALPTLPTLVGCYSVEKPKKIPKKNLVGSVVVIGGGFGGATAAKYLSLWSRGRIEITLIEKNQFFYSCPMSNLVLGGHKDIDFITHNYQGLIQRGIKVIRDEVVSIDPVNLSIRTRTGRSFSADKLIVSPGIEFEYENIEGLSLRARKRVLHAWRAGPQTLALKSQINTMPDGGVFVISVPRAPYRCPPGPYERACQVAHYFKLNKPRSKVLILDANPQIQSKKKLFISAWDNLYKNIIEYIPNVEINELDLGSKTLISLFGDRVKGDVLNVIPPNRAGEIAKSTGLITTNNKWCDVNWLTLESVKFKNIHILGDSTLATEKMPKSGHMANQHGKVVAYAIIKYFDGTSPNPSKMINTCYSFVNNNSAVHVARVYDYDEKLKTMLPNLNAGGLSDTGSFIEGKHAFSWAKSIWADTLL
ncbi:MAG: flavocytochrome C [Betaproteobacteria bacterium TMED156]|nr:MAG: flavocytochrome C [Betaproteobacteria bacterium TMED156]